MKFSITNQETAQKWIEIFKIIKNLNTYTTIYGKEDSLFIQIMDDSHICLMNIDIKKDWFSSYELSSGIEEVLSFHSNIIVKILNLYVNNCVMIFESTDEKFEISFQYEDKTEKIFQIPLINIDNELLESQNIEGSLEFEIDTKVFDKYISEMLMFGDSMEFICYKDNLYMKSSGEEGNYSLKIPYSTINEMIVEEDLKLKTSVTLKYLHFLTKSNGVFKTIKLKIQENYPFQLMIDEPMFLISYYVAPKFTDDDDDNMNDYSEFDNSDDEELKNIVM